MSAASSRLSLALRPLLIGVLAAAAMAPATAERADRNKPMTVEADRGRYDDQKGVTTFTGNVVASKGTILIRAGEIEVRQTSDGHHIGIATATPGKLASFRQKREGVDETIQGEAERVEYDSRADTVRLVNRAVIRRYRGSTLADETSGSLITYDNTREIFSVSGDGALNAGEMAPTPGGRVRATLTPPGADATGTPGAASAPPLPPLEPLQPLTPPAASSPPGDAR